MATLCLVALPLALSAACAPGGRDAPDHAPRPRLLGSLGFALSDDGDASTPAGTLNATFDAPVVSATGALDSYGTAHVAFDDAARDLASATVTGAVSGSDIVYAVLFDPDVPWRYVVVASHGAALTADATLPLDNDSAAAIVVDEETGSGYLTDGGTLTITSADLAEGGRLVAALAGDLVEVTLDSWPQNLFPFTNDGSELETVTAAGSGSFAALWSERGELVGSAAFSIEVAGFGAFTADQASAMPLDEVSTAIVLASSADPDHLVVALADTAELTAGASLAFDGFTTGAWFLAADGTQVAFTEGALSFVSASLTDGGVVEGALSITGSGYVLPADAWSGEGEGEGEWQDEDCTGLDTLASAFVPTTVHIDTGFGPGELPAGYDRVLTFMDDGVGMLGLIVSSEVDFEAPAPYAFDVVDYDGRPWPAAVLGLATCSQLVDVQSGSLTALVEDGAMTGELVVVTQGATRTIALDVAVLAP